MRFFLAKNELRCRGCGGTIGYGEEAVIIKWKQPKTEATIPLVCHVSRYIPWVERNYYGKWNDWHLGVNPRPKRKKRGRKFIYASKEQAEAVNRAKSLINYHKKAGNTDRVAELEVELASIRV